MLIRVLFVARRRVDEQPTVVAARLRGVVVDVKRTVRNVSEVVCQRRCRRHFDETGVPAAPVLDGRVVGIQDSDPVHLEGVTVDRWRDGPHRQGPDPILVLGERLDFSSPRGVHYDRPGLRGSHSECDPSVVAHNGRLQPSLARRLCEHDARADGRDHYADPMSVR